MPRVDTVSVRDNLGRLRNIGVVEVGPDPPNDPTVGTLWLDTDATETPTVAHTTITTSTLLTSAHTRVKCNAAAGAIVVSLPPVAARFGESFEIRKNDSSDNAVTIDPDGAETINGDATLVLYRKDESVTISCDATEWSVW